MSLLPRPPWPAGVQLKWETSDEVNNKGYHIERSANGTSWETLGFVAAQTGQQAIYSYQFTDGNPQSGTNYYRLKQEDLDRSYTYSATRNIQHHSAGRSFIFPNPVEQTLSLVTQETRFEGQIVTVEGKVITRFVNQKNIPVSSLPPGIYYLKLFYDGKVENLKWLKR